MILAQVETYRKQHASFYLDSGFYKRFDKQPRKIKSQSTVNTFQNELSHQTWHGLPCLNRATEPQRTQDQTNQEKNNNNRNRVGVKASLHRAQSRTRTTRETGWFFAQIAVAIESGFPRENRNMF